MSTVLSMEYEPAGLGRPVARISVRLASDDPEAVDKAFARMLKWYREAERSYASRAHLYSKEAS